MSDAFSQRQLGTLLLSLVRLPGAGTVSMARTAAWSNQLQQLGLHLPLFIVHDLGLLLTAGRQGAQIEPKPDAWKRLNLPPQVVSDLGRYQQLLQVISESEVVERASAHLSDPLVVVVLAKILGDLYQRWREPQKTVGTAPVDAAALAASEAEVEQAFLQFDPRALYGFVHLVATEEQHLYTAVELIDTDTLRLLGAYAGGAASSLALVDLLAVLQSPEANDVVNFSLELLPSILETKRSSGAQSFAIDGYASIERRGSLDSLLLSEFALDDDLFEQKFVDSELYFYGHEKQQEEERRLHYILVDASASMRGVRQVFGRAVALTLAKKLLLQGERVAFRFFDSRLHDLQKLSPQDLAAPYVLGFKSERGRNYTKVFGDLKEELERLRRTDEVALYLITHGQCHIARETVQALTKAALVYGIIILPSSDVELDYLDVLHRTQIVDADTLRSRSKRRERALELVRDAAARAQG